MSGDILNRCIHGNLVGSEIWCEQCKAMSLGGRGDNPLPSLKELESILAVEPISELSAEELLQEYDQLEWKDPVPSSRAPHLRAEILRRLNIREEK